MSIDILIQFTIGPIARFTKFKIKHFFTLSDNNLGFKCIYLIKNIFITFLRVFICHQLTKCGLNTLFIFKVLLHQFVSMRYNLYFLFIKTVIISSAMKSFCLNHIQIFAFQVIKKVLIFNLRFFLILKHLLLANMFLFF